MSTNYDDVATFSVKFGLRTPVGPQPWDDELMKLRLDRLDEELREFKDAYDARDHAEMLDALIDLTWIVMGTAYLLGYPWQAAWNEVTRANLAKQRAATDGSDSKHGSRFDVVKPAGWTAPDVAAVMAAAGFARCPECGTCAVYEIIGPDHTAEGTPALCSAGHQFYALGLT